MAANREATGLVALRLFLGVFFLFHGLAKIGWLTSSEALSQQFADWSKGASSWSQAYLQAVAIPYLEVWARVVPIAEMGAGVAMMLGLFTRWAALGLFVMLVNFHVANGAIFTYAYITFGGGPPVLGGLLALAIGAGRLPWSVKG